MLIFELKCTSFKTQQFNLFVTTWREIKTHLHFMITNTEQNLVSFAEHHILCII